MAERTVEVYSDERKAAFLLDNAVNDKDYRAAREAVLRIGLDPDQIEHKPPVTASNDSPTALP